MNQKLFSQAMTEISDKYYEEAARYQCGHKRTLWMKWGAAAAGLCLMVLGTAMLLNHSMPDSPVEGNKFTDSSDASGAPMQKQPETELPLLTVRDDGNDPVGGGFEAYWAYNISELVNANPWNESMELSILPVYKNPVTYDDQYHASGVDLDKMREFILEIAARFGLDTDTLTIEDTYNFPDSYLIIETDGLKIKVDQTMMAEISFNPAISLPAEYNFTFYAPYEDVAAAAEYLKTEYKNIIGMDNPQVNIHGGDYNYYAEQDYYINFFDSDGSDTAQIINYNFNKVFFYCDGEGTLFLARIFRPDLSVKTGDYPIISPKEATVLLLNGNYFTSAPYEMPGSEYVRKVELIYRTGKFEEYYMPYYCFYVELPEEEIPHDLKTYGTYYVPAVSGEYIANMPTGNGRFNY